MRGYCPSLRSRIGGEPLSRGAVEPAAIDPGRPSGRVCAKQAIENALLQRPEFGRPSVARTGKIDGDVKRDRPALEEKDPIGDSDGFGDVMRDENRGKRSRRQTNSTSCCISIRVRASRAPNGSSSASARGRLTSARASATRCFCPPDRTEGQSSARSASPTERSASSARSRSDASRRSSPRPTSTLASTLAQGRRRGSWNMTRMTVRAASSARSPKAIWPWSANRDRRAAATGCSCRTRCVRRWPRIGLPAHRDRGREARSSRQMPWPVRAQ